MAESFEFKTPQAVKIIPRRVEKQYIWHCELCRTNWTYDRNLNEHDNWTAFIAHSNAKGQRCHSYPVEKMKLLHTSITDIRIILRYQWD